MPKKKVKDLPKPTKKLYQCFDLSFYYRGRSKEKPRPVNVSFSELFLDLEDGCVVRVRANLQIDKIARMMHEDHNDFPMCDGAMNYAGILNRQLTYLCDMSGGGDPGDSETWVWYEIDNTTSQDKTVKRISRGTYREHHLTFSEADKINFDRKFEFDGHFADLLEALRAEGFQIIES